jgi:hypothetical protein
MVKIDVMTDRDIETKVAEYEATLDMSSGEFLDHVREGTAPDTFEAMALKMLLRFSSKQILDKGKT